MSTPTEFPDHQRLEHRDIIANIYKNRETTFGVGTKVGEELCEVKGYISRSKDYVADKVCDTKDFLGLKVDNTKTEIKDNTDRYYISGEANADVRAKNLLDAIQQASSSSTTGFYDIKNGIDASRERLQEQLYEQNTVNVAAHRDTILELTKDICATQKEVAQGFAQGSLEHCRDTGALSKQMSDGFAAVQLEAAKNYSAIQLEAKQNKFELSRQLADCCCEMKEKLIETASATQQLIRDQENNRLRDSLAAANNENLYLRLNGGSGGHGGR
jgi:hypothetical protein